MPHAAAEEENNAVFSSVREFSAPDIEEVMFFSGLFLHLRLSFCTHIQELKAAETCVG